MKIDTRWPDAARADCGAVVVTEITVGTAERQQAMAETFTAGWKDEPAPAGMLGAALFAGAEGAHMLIYGEWENEEAYLAFERAQREARARQMAQAVPGMERNGPFVYRLYRSRRLPDAPPPGCLVTVSVEFDGPDTARQRRWVDTVFEAMEAEETLPEGGISGNFFVSTDGRRVFNYAEWVDEASHRRALEASGQGTVGRGPKWREVMDFPGVVARSARRYRLACSLAPQLEAAGRLQ